MSVSGVQAEKITVVLCGYRILTDFISGFLQCRNDHNVYEILRPQSDELLIRSCDEANDAIRVRIQPSTNTRMPPGKSDMLVVGGCRIMSTYVACRQPVALICRKI